jgi:hypothetical protein
MFSVQKGNSRMTTSFNVSWVGIEIGGRISVNILLLTEFLYFMTVSIQLSKNKLCSQQDRITFRMEYGFSEAN